SDAAPDTRRGDHRSPKKSCGVAGHRAGTQRRRALTDAVVALAPASGMTAAACIALGVSRASVQRRRARLTAPPAEVSTGADRPATADRAGSPARATLRRPGAGRNLRQSARPRPLSLLDPYHVSHPRPPRRGPRTPRPAPPPRLPEARTPGRTPQPEPAPAKALGYAHMSC